MTQLRTGNWKLATPKITMDIRRKIQQLEARIGSTFDRKVSELVQARTREPLEIVHAVVDRTAREVQSSGRGRRVFPFTALTLTVAAASRDERARLEAVFNADPPLGARILQRLRSDGCAVEHLDVTVQFVPRAQKNWEQPQYHVEFVRSAAAATARLGECREPAPGQVRIELTVLNGAAQKRTFVVGGARIDLGRCAEVRDSRHRLIRTESRRVRRAAGRRESKRVPPPRPHLVRRTLGAVPPARRRQRAWDRDRARGAHGAGATRGARRAAVLGRRDRPGRGPPSRQVPRRGTTSAAAAGGVRTRFNGADRHPSSSRS